MSITYKSIVYLAYLPSDEELFANTPKIKGLLVKKIRTADRIFYHPSKRQSDRNVQNDKNEIKERSLCYNVLKNLDFVLTITFYYLYLHK